MTLKNEPGNQSPNLMRRTFVISSAAGALVSGFAARALAGIGKLGKNPDATRCAEEHVSISRKLAGLMQDPLFDDAARGHALKTASCGHCHTRIGLSEV